MDKNKAVQKDLEDIDSKPFTFGKFRGKTPDEVSEMKPDYIVWMWEKFDDPPCSEAMYNFCKKDVAKWSSVEGD